jgi:hypothetical protein
MSAGSPEPGVQAICSALGDDSDRNQLVVSTPLFERLQESDPGETGDVDLDELVAVPEPIGH